VLTLGWTFNFVCYNDIKKFINITFGMILFFYGEASYQSSQLIIQLKKKFFQKNPTGGGLVEFNCDSKCNLDEIILSFGEQSLFASKKLIIIENFFANTLAPEQKDVIERLEGSVEDVVVFFEKDKVRKNAVMYKWLIKNAQTVKENKLLEGNDLEKWIVSEVQRSDKKIELNAVKELILFVGGDLWQLAQEIEKLVCFVKGGKIVVQNVHDIVHGRTQADMFEMIEAIVSNNKETAITLLKKQIAAGDDAFHIFSMYAYQVRILVNVSGMTRSGIHDNSVIAKTLKLHPFVVQKTMSLLNNMSYKRILAMHKKLTALDYDIKRGERDIESALDLFVVA